METGNFTHKEVKEITGYMPDGTPVYLILPYGAPTKSHNLSLEIYKLLACKNMTDGEIDALISSIKEQLHE